MKRKIAFVLAAVLAISGYMPNTVQAATSNFIDNRMIVPADTAFFENGLATLMPNAGHDRASGEPSWFANGTDLVLPLMAPVKAGDQFRLILTNGTWFFRAYESVSTGVPDLGTSLSALGVTDQTLVNTTNGTASDWTRGADTVVANKDFSGIATPPYPYRSTYNPAKGLYFPDSRSDNGDYGVYYRANAASRIDGSATYYEIPYKLEVSGLNKSNATVTILSDFANGNPKAPYTTASPTPSYEVRIPLITRSANDNVDVTVTIDSGNISSITSAKIIYASSSTSKTVASVTDIAISRDTFEPGDIVIAETRPGTIRQGEIIKLSLPYGYHFQIDDDTGVGVESGLSWGTAGLTGYGVRDTDYTIEFRGTSNYIDKLTGNVVYTGDYYDNEVWITLLTLNASTQLRGSVYVSNLRFWVDDNVPVPTDGQSADIMMHVDGKDNITAEDILIGQRVDWAVSLKTTNTIPTLVSGRYIYQSWSGIDADDNTHKTAHVQMYESTVNAWWSSRSTVLALPATDNNTVKGAKFRKVQITDTSNLFSDSSIDYGARLKDTSYPSTMYGLSGADIGGGVYLNDGERHGYVTVNDNLITLTNIRIATNKKSSIDFDLWVSVELGFGKQTGDLKLAIDPSTSSLTGTQTSFPSVVIAHVVDPITVTTKVSDLKIGYQYQPTADIQITENGSGYLLQNKTVRVSITDLISSDMWFTPDTIIQVTAGDMKIKNISTNGIGGFTSQSLSTLSSGSTDNASIAFDIDRPSTAASTITISNVAVKLDRSVPVTNRQSYQAVVWGTAVAENYGLTSPASGTGTAFVPARTWKAGFNTAGVYAPYINVISSPSDQSSILSQEVRVPIGENYYTVNGVSYSMPAAAYISPASNSTMVPVRFVANAFGLRDDNQIVWDDTNKTVTIFAPNRTVQFTLNKSIMIVDGVSVTMFSPDNLPVVAEIKSDRMYIPFRALGQAFGVPVTWDPNTQTAIYNEGANTNLNAATSNTDATVNNAGVAVTPS